jgi:hypothetical protein
VFSSIHTNNSLRTRNNDKKKTKTKMFKNHLILHHKWRLLLLMILFITLLCAKNDSYCLAKNVDDSLHPTPTDSSPSSSASLSSRNDTISTSRPSVFYLYTAHAPWRERDSFRFFTLKQSFQFTNVKTHQIVTATVGNWFLYGGHVPGLALNDVWVSNDDSSRYNRSTCIGVDVDDHNNSCTSKDNDPSSNSTLSWDIAAGVNRCIPPQSSASPNTFPTTETMIYCEDPNRFILYALSTRVSNCRTNAVYRSTNGLVWHPTVPELDEALLVSDASCVVASSHSVLILGGLRTPQLQNQDNKTCNTSSNQMRQPASSNPTPLHSIELNHVKRKSVQTTGQFSDVLATLDIGDPNLALSNEVFISKTEEGKEWERRTRAPWSPRMNSLTLAAYNNPKYPSVIYMIGGETVPYVVNVTNTTTPSFVVDAKSAIENHVIINSLNDVWASTDDGHTWNIISVNAPWSARNRLSGAIDVNGTLVISSGWSFSWTVKVNSSNIVKLQQDVTPRVWYYDDVWFSFDGGYSWQQCIPSEISFDTKYYPSSPGMNASPLFGRASSALMIDEDGHILLGGGYRSFVQYNDIIRSKFSIFDLNQVASYCSLYSPPSHQPIGLTCLPGDANCPPEPPQPPSSSSSSTGREPIIPPHHRDDGLSKSMQAIIFLCCLIITTGAVASLYLYCTRRSHSRRLPDPVQMGTPYTRF